jgi:phosphohistidine swiveling domain-containing protein
MHAHQKEEWEELIRSDFCPYNVCIPLHSIQYSNEYVGGPQYEKLLLYINEGIGYYYENFADHFKVGKYCLDRFMKDKTFFKKYIKHWKKEFTAFNHLMAEIRETDISKKNKNQLAQLLKQIYDEGIQWHGIAYNVDAIDAALNPILQDLIADCFPGQKKSKLSEIYNTITFPDTLSYVNRMHLDQLALFEEMEKNGIKESQEKIDAFVNSYYWINFKWGPSTEYTQQEIVQEMKKHNQDLLAESLSALNTKFKQAWNKKQELVKKIAEKNAKIIAYIDIFDEYAVLHDLRKEGQVKSVYYIRMLYHAAAKLLKCKPELLYYQWPLELVEVLEGIRVFDTDLLHKRTKEVYYEYYADGHAHEYFGQQAIELKNAALESTYANQSKEVSGIGASQGRVVGTARICLSADSALEKISDGDILVTGMTMPDFVPAMKLSRAVVTDEGGLTCHAAIIARELGIPCVVGTKMATRVIEDGDTLEVNANHGVVKIVKKGK